MAEIIYSISQDFSQGFSHTTFTAEINADATLAPLYVGTDVLGDVVTVVFTVTLDSVQEAILDGIVSAHNAQGGLLDAKELKFAEIDQKTKFLIETGTVSFQSKSVKISSNRQLTTLVLFNQRTDATQAYPVVLSAANNTDTISLANATEVENWHTSLAGAVQSILDSGHTLKEQVRAAIDIAGVDAVVDNR